MEQIHIGQSELSVVIGDAVRDRCDVLCDRTEILRVQRQLPAFVIGEAIRGPYELF